MDKYAIYAVRALWAASLIRVATMPTVSWFDVLIVFIATSCVAGLAEAILDRSPA